MEAKQARNNEMHEIIVHAGPIWWSCMCTGLVGMNPTAQVSWGQKVKILLNDVQKL
jgi:hypothetical protein